MNEQTDARATTTFVTWLDLLFGSGAAAWVRFSAFCLTLLSVGFAVGQWGVREDLKVHAARIETVETVQRVREANTAEIALRLTVVENALAQAGLPELSQRIERMDRELCLVLGEQTPQECARR